MLSLLLVFFPIILFATLGSASPLYFRPPAPPLSASTTVVQTSSIDKSAVTLYDVTSVMTKGSKNIGNDLDLAWMLEGNEKFQDQIAKLEQLRIDPHNVLFIGCSDNRFAPDVIFQSGLGSTTTHLNLGNQFSSQDYSSNTAINYAIEELGVKHIVVLGHYGCKSVEKAASQLPVSTNLRKWLQPIMDLYSKSKRLEIRRLRVLKKGSDAIATEQAVPSGLRALVEENVKVGVKNLMKEVMPLLNQGKSGAIDLYGHGLVFNEETGEITDLNVSFGPPGKPVVQVPFKAVPKARMHIPYGKFDPKAKKQEPSSTSTSDAQSDIV